MKNVLSIKLAEVHKARDILQEIDQMQAKFNNIESSEPC